MKTWKNCSLEAVAKYTLRNKCPYSELLWSAFFLHFPALGLNTERYEVPLLIQSECGKNADQNNPEYGQILRSDKENEIPLLQRDN